MALLRRDYVRYDTTFLSVQGAILEPIVDEDNSAYYFTGTYWKKVIGELALDTSYNYSGPVSIVAFKSALSINSAATVNNAVINRTCIYNPVIEELRYNNQLVQNGSSYFNVGIYAPGDLNSDGIVSSDDTYILGGYLVSDPNCGYTSSMALSADVDRDGSVTSDDLTLIIQYQGGSINSFEDYSDIL